MSNYFVTPSLEILPFFNTLDTNCLLSEIGEKAKKAPELLLKAFLIAPPLGLEPRTP